MAGSGTQPPASDYPLAHGGHYFALLLQDGVAEA